jgi:response regulator RpfG family c-di-GMP phosphodiesterase
MQLTDTAIERFYQSERARNDVRLITTANFLGLVALSLDTMDDHDADQQLQRTANQLADIAEEYGLDPDDLQHLIFALEPSIEAAA